MKYIQRFNNHEDFRNKTAAYDKLVSLCYNDAHIHFGQTDNGYENECFSIKILSGEDITITINYNPALESAAIKKSTTITYCDSVTGIITENANAETVTGNAGVMTIGGLNSGDQIWLYTAGTAFRPYTTTVDSTTTQYGALQFEITGGQVSLQGNLMSILADNVNSMYAENNQYIINTSSVWYHMCRNMFNFNAVTQSIGSTSYNGNNAIVYAHNLILPIKSVPQYAYFTMFYGCFSLKTIPQLPATTLASYCYSGIFKGCSSLEDVSYLKLPATGTLPASAYREMFYHCVSLKYAMKELKVNCNITNGQYTCANMFYMDSSLISAPAIYAGNVGGYSFSNMFAGCTNLINAKVLNVTGKFGFYACNRMFYNCKKLENVFEELICKFNNGTGEGTIQYHFREMFSNCKALKRAPTIIPQNGKIYAWTCNYMFAACDNLNYIDCSHITDRSDNSATNYMLQSIEYSATKPGIFVMNSQYLNIWPNRSNSNPQAGPKLNQTVIDENGAELEYDTANSTWKRIE